jgi:hypothetical protein
MWSTEDGWDTTPDAADKSVSENVQSKYTLRQMFWALFDAEFDMTIIYSLLDDYDDSSGGDSEAHYGIVRKNMTPKPAYYTVKRLLGLLAEPNALTFEPQPLDYSLSGSIQDVKAYVLQKSTGTHYVVLYHDVP